MDEPELHFDFERSLNAVGSTKPLLRSSSKRDNVPTIPELPSSSIGQQPGNFKKNYRQTVCTYWLKGLCMKGESCGFLHQLDPQRMPVCRAILKYGVCKEPDCLFKHSLDDVKECNMFKLGFCIYGNNCRYKHTKLPGPPPSPESLEAAKPREYRNINIVVNEVNPNIATGDSRPVKRPRYGGTESSFRQGNEPIVGAPRSEKPGGFRDPSTSYSRQSEVKPHQQSNRVMMVEPPPPLPGPLARARKDLNTNVSGRVEPFI